MEERREEMEEARLDILKGLLYYFRRPIGFLK